jgi:hypothetical protein
MGFYNHSSTYLGDTKSENFCAHMNNYKLLKKTCIINLVEIIQAYAILIGLWVGQSGNP